MMVAPVCHVEDPLQLTCTSSVEFIRWNVFQANEEVIKSVQINSRDTNQMPRNIVVNSATFNFMRRSAQGVSPLISTLSINSVSIGFNGTVVRCSDVENPTTSASTTIQVINIHQIGKLTKHIIYLL